MPTAKKISILAVLVLITIYFSGCSIRKKDDVADTPAPAVTEKKEEPKKIDTDSDGLFDDEEEKLGTDKDIADTDADGVSDLDEVRKWKTKPLVKDTDGDGYEDGTEVAAGYDPNGPGQLDSDSDGLTDPEEKRLGTDPQDYDSDDDGLNDKEEIDGGRDPWVAE